MKLKLKKAVSLDHPLTDPKNWCQPGIFKAPSFNRDRYQEELDKIFGLSVDGYSICRVSWAWEQRQWENIEWDEFGNAVKGEWRQKYKALTVEIGNDEYVDIAPARWVLEERFEPGQYERSWNQSRYVHDPAECGRCTNRATVLTGLMALCVNRLRDGHESAGCGICRRKFSEMETSTTCTRRDIWGAAPREGWYNLLPRIGMVAEHELSMRCCDRLWKQSREICYGRYKVPDGRELQILREAVARRNADPEADPHRELSERSLQQAKAWGLTTMAEMKVASRQEMKDRWKDEVDTHGAKLCTPTELAALHTMGVKPPRMREIFDLAR